MRRVVVRAYGALVRLLPPDFVREYGEAMRWSAQDDLDEARGVVRGVSVVVRLAADLAWTFGREWAATLRPARYDWGRGDGMGTHTVRDIRFALRSFRRTPMITALIVGTLGLGIGANTAIFSVLNAVVLRPLPFPEPDALVSVWPGKLFSLELYDATRDGVNSLEDVSLYGGAVLTITEGGDPAELFGGEVTHNHFDLMGVAPALGRDFVAADAAPGSVPVVLLSHDLWSRRFGADPGILGTSIALQHEDEPRRTVVGIMPRGYRDILNGAAAWVPVVEDRATEEYGGSSFANAVGRLRDGASVPAAGEEMAATARRVREVDPGQYSATEVERATVSPLVDELARSLRRMLTALLVAVGVVLLIASVNVANLLLVRASARVREFSIRSALGGGRWQLLRQFVTESVLLGLAGGAVGIAVAWLTRDLLLSALPGGFRVDETGLDGAVLLFTLAVALGSSVLFGVAPALQSIRRPPADALSNTRGAGAARAERRLQNALVSVEIALALVSVFASGVLVQSMRELTSVDPGFTPENVITFRLTASPDVYAGDEEVLSFFRRVETAVAELPGVSHAGAVGRLPLNGGMSRISYYPEGFEPGDSGELPDATHRLVTAGYAETMQFRLVEGRFPSAAEFADGPKLGYVTKGLADRHWPDGAVGRRFIGRGEVPWLTVAGVIEDVREDALHGPVLPGVYIPHRDWAWRTMFVTARTAGDPELAMDAIREAVWGIAPSVPISRVRSLEQVIERSVEETRLTGRLFTLFGGLALILGAVGVYGVMAHALDRRRHEFGIRLALGAPRPRLVRGALGQGVGPLVLGLVLGVALTYPVGRTLGGALESVTAAHPAVLVGAAGIMASVAVVAMLLPSARATRVDPARSLRAE